VWCWIVWARGGPPEFWTLRHSRSIFPLVFIRVPKLRWISVRISLVSKMVVG